MKFLMQTVIDIKNWCKFSSNEEFLFVFFSEWITLISVAVHLHLLSISARSMRALSTMIGKFEQPSTLLNNWELSNLINWFSVSEARQTNELLRNSSTKTIAFRMNK